MESIPLYVCYIQIHTTLQPKYTDHANTVIAGTGPRPSSRVYFVASVPIWSPSLSTYAILKYTLHYKQMCTHHANTVIAGTGPRPGSRV